MSRFVLAACLLAVAGSAAMTSAARATVPFTPGNIVVERVGYDVTKQPSENGTGSTANYAFPVYLDEFTEAGTYVQTIGMPQTSFGANRRLVEPKASFGGGLTRSTSGQFLLVPGYDAPIGAGPECTNGLLTNCTAATYARVVGVVYPTGFPTVTTGLTGSAADNSFTSVAGRVPFNGTTTDGQSVYTASLRGVLKPVLGNTDGSPQSIFNDTKLITGSVGIFGGDLFVASGPNSSPPGPGPNGVCYIHRYNGMPTAQSTPTQIFTFTSANIGVNCNGSGLRMAGFDLNPSVPGIDTLYVAGVSLNFGIRKLVYDGTTWSLAGTGTGTAAGKVASPVIVAGLTGYATGSTVKLFYIDQSSGADKLVTVTDTGGSGAPNANTPTILVTANGYNQGSYGYPGGSTDVTDKFKGVALTPQGVFAGTAVDWIRGSASSTSRGVIVRWSTGTETRNLGYDVMRVRRGATTRVKLTRSLVPGSALVSTERTKGKHHYRFRDASGRVGDRYLVIDRSTDGSHRTHGPFRARR